MAIAYFICLDTVTYAIKIQRKPLYVHTVSEETMSSSSAAFGGAKSPLDAAQKIVAELTGMAPEHQALALKFATETLGVPFLAPPQSPANPSALPTHAPTPPPSGTAPYADIKAFTALKAPKSDQQFAAVVAYFYQFEAPLDSRKEIIDVQTMKDAARLAGRKQAPQWRFTLQNAKNAGYLNSAGDGKFKLSPVGENLVAITLPGNGTTGTGASKPAKKKPKKKVSRRKTLSKRG